MSSPVPITLCIAILFVGSLTHKAAAIDASMSIYSDSFYGDRLATINFHHVNRCYNIDCSTWNDKIESARWSGLSSPTYTMVFYGKKNCEGAEVRFQYPSYGGQRYFRGTGVAHDISSFMVLSESAAILDGISNVCEWSGAEVVGCKVDEIDGEGT